ncbi:MAG: hypothetical protein BGO68_01900 [Candidatus Amoebophilus sp. 36-38]|nr:MAG: hypothetical protein BGO68_01900 [Candidatus Amoebophilus sp. 36-38]
MKIIGKIADIKESQQVSAGFKKRAFVVEYAENPQYLEYILFELIQDRCELLDTFQVGQEVEVSFNLKGRKWVNPEGETKYFNSLQAWRIESPSSNTTEQKPVPEVSTTPISEEDDLPF